MSHKYLGIIFSGFLIVGMTPIVPALQAQGTLPPGATAPQDKPPVSSIEDIRKAQIALKDKGYDPGEINGLMSSDTREAVKKFQEANNLPMTGNLDDRTTALLQINLQEKGPGPVDRMKPADVPNPRLSKDILDRISNSASVLQASVASGDKRIPDAILQRADAILVIPHMVKGAIGVGGTYGKGMLTRRHEDGRWSAPLFVSLAGGNFGAQLGLSATDLVLVFTDGKALKPLEDGSTFKVGVDASVVAGPLGRDAEAGTNAHLDGGIYAYSHSKGLFAGIALDGAVLQLDKGVNMDVYGPSADAHQILTTEYANASEKPFMDAVNRVTTQRKTAGR